MFMIDMEHAEKKANGDFCCCDKDDTCTADLSQLETCEEGKCDILLNVTVSPCTESTSSGPCSIFTNEIHDAENFGDYIYGYMFYFKTTAQAMKVREYSITQSIYTYKYTYTYKSI